MFITIMIMAVFREAEARFKIIIIIIILSRNYCGVEDPRSSSRRPYLRLSSGLCVLSFCEPMLPYLSHIMVLNLLNFKEYFIYLTPSILESSDYIFHCYILGIELGA